MRVRDSRLLLRGGHHAGSYYLVGYAVECALKACIARATRRYSFPDKKIANEAYTHDLERLLRLAGLTSALDRDMTMNATLALNWAIVKDWAAEDRYEINITEPMARDMYVAVTARVNGILPWVKQHW